MVFAAALFTLVFVVYCICTRIPAVPGLEDRDDRNAAEKKRAYQLELQRQVYVISEHSGIKPLQC